MLNEKNYPMNFKDFEKKVVEFYLEKLSNKELEALKPALDEELAKEPNFLESVYGTTCFVYDHPEIYGDDVKKVFEDEMLKRRAVPQVEDFIG